MLTRLFFGRENPDMAWGLFRVASYRNMFHARGWAGHEDEGGTFVTERQPARRRPPRRPPRPQARPAPALSA